MKISGVDPKGTSSTRRADKSGGTGRDFSTHLSESVSEGDAVDDARGTDGPRALTGIESILAAQGVGPDQGGQGGRANKRLVQRGEDLLDRLEEVRRGLLIGSIPKDRLSELARLVRSKRDAGADPHLSAILDEIELRAEVELAKLTRRE